MILWRIEALSGRQLVIRVERRRVAYGAAFLYKHFLTARSQAIELVRVRRRLERVNVERQSVELLVAVPVASRRVGQGSEVTGRRNESAVAGQIRGALIQRGVTHQVRNRTMPYHGSMIKVLSLAYADQIRNLRRIKRTRSLAGDHARRNRPVPVGHL